MSLPFIKKGKKGSEIVLSGSLYPMASLEQLKDEFSGVIMDLRQSGKDVVILLAPGQEDSAPEILNMAFYLAGRARGKK
jgi:hypothetical protein